VTAAELLALAVEAAEARGDSFEGGTLSRLLMGLRVRAMTDDSVPTVAIRADSDGYTLLANPIFCDAHVAGKPASALALVLHELLHILRGHLRMVAEPDERTRSWANLALDMQVNRLVVASPEFRAIGSPDIFSAVYDPMQFPENLLLPPADLGPATGSKSPWSQMSFEELIDAVRSEEVELQVVSDVAGHLSRLDVRHAGAFARAYVRTWLTSFDAPEALVSRMKALFLAEFGDGGPSREIVLLGDHEGAIAPPGGLVARPVVPALRNALEPRVKWQEARQERAARGKPSRAQLEKFSRQVVVALEAGAGGQDTRARRSTISTPIPSPGRRDLSLLAAGFLPAIWHPRKEVRRVRRAGLRVYVDTSGSMEERLPLLFALVHAIGERLVPPVWCWSLGEPVAVTLHDIAAGRYPTRGGTDIEPVIEHAVAVGGFKRLLVLTDGLFTVSPELARRVRDESLEITAVLPADYRWVQRGELESITRQIFVLERD
jgi:hypothetical protein